jgi:phosphoglycolate phosphatase-like HAD superfamily hydrolase
MILYAIQNFEIRQPGEVIKVGDSAIDIEEGKNARCALSMNYNRSAFHHQLLLANPDFIISDLLDCQIIDNYNNTRT